MITIQIQGSSSAGNNYVISDGDTSIMLEAGLSPSKLTKKGVKLSNFFLVYKKNITKVTKT